MKISENGVYKEIEDFEIEIPKEYQIMDLKQNLADTDYQAIKYAEGLISDEDYAETKQLRQEWREEINRLEKELIF